MLKYIITLIVFLFLTGLLSPLLARIGFGRLPGDNLFSRPGQRFNVPFTSSLLLSLLASLMVGRFL